MKQVLKTKKALIGSWLILCLFTNCTKNELMTPEGKLQTIDMDAGNVQATALFQ